VEQQDLSVAAAVLEADPGRQHTGVVQHHQVARAQQLGQLLEAQVTGRGGRGKVQQPRATAFRKWTLSDQLSGKLIVVVGEALSRSATRAQAKSSG
jgi:hypothetical protein